MLWIPYGSRGMHLLMENLKRPLLEHFEQPMSICRKYISRYRDIDITLLFQSLPILERLKMKWVLLCKTSQDQCNAPKQNT